MKFWNYIMISIGLTLIFELAGVSIAEGLLNLVGIDIASGIFNIKSAEMWTKVFVGTGILVTIVGAVIIGVITRSSPENYVILPFLVLITGVFIIPFIFITNYALGNYDKWIALPVTFIMVFLTVGFILSAVEFFRGTD